MHEAGGSNFSDVRRALRSFIGGKLAEEVVPISFSQYLVDLPIVEALEVHPRRTSHPEHADWHILAATPFASRLLALLQANVSADGQRCCQPSGHCPTCSSVPATQFAHRERIAALSSYLTINRWWNKPNVPFVLFSTGDDRRQRHPVCGFRSWDG